MLKRQNAKDHSTAVNNVCRRICAEEKLIPVLKRLKLLRVSAKYVDIALGVSGGTASEWFGNRREVPKRYIHELIRLEIRVSADICNYLETPNNARLFKVPDIERIKDRVALVRAMRLDDSAYRTLPDEGEPERDKQGLPIFGSPGL